METCETCNWFKLGYIGVVGECELDMEGKTVNDSCHRWQPKKE